MLFQAYGLTHAVAGFTGKGTSEYCDENNIQAIAQVVTDPLVAGFAEQVDSTFTCLQKDAYLVKGKSVDACVCRTSYEDLRDYWQFHDQIHHDCN